MKAKLDKITLGNSKVVLDRRNDGYHKLYIFYATISVSIVIP
jgi:hypothetical protein